LLIIYFNNNCDYCSETANNLIRRLCEYYGKAKMFIFNRVQVSLNRPKCRTLLLLKTDALALKHNKTAMSQLRDEINLDDGFMRK